VDRIDKAEAFFTPVIPGNYGDSIQTRRHLLFGPSCVDAIKAVIPATVNNSGRPERSLISLHPSKSSLTA
jgi:hypothetical protein